MNTISTQKNKSVLSYISPFRLNAGAILAFASLLVATSGIGQTTIFSDNFGIAATSPFTGGTATVPVAATYTASTATAVISTKLDGADGYVNFISNGAAGRPYLVYPFSGVSSDFHPVLSANSGPVTWTVNMKILRNLVMSSSNNENYADGNYNSVFILCSNSSNLTSNTTGTNGYAVIYQRSSFDATKNGIRLVRFSNGLLAGPGAIVPGPSVYTKLIESAAYPTSFIFSKSVKVVYTPSTGNWELLTRDDPSGTFVDPLSTSAPAFVSAGNNSDAMYTSTPMTHFGILASLSTSTSAANSFQFDNLKLTVIPPVLPVQMTGISATIKTKGVDITWNVENEISILQYEVERSSNNGIFTYVGTLKANNINSYSLNDANPFTGTIYYRIKIVGIGGEIKYSPIVVVKKLNVGVSIYPNPASDVLMVYGLNNAIIKIRSLIGQLVMQKITRGNTIGLDISTLKPGTFLIEVANDGQEAINKIFIKE